MKELLVVVLLAFFASPVSAQSGLVFGTEELPELPASGPPTYGVAYTGPQDHDYLKILAGWFAYDNTTDEILWTLKVAGGTGYTSPEPEWRIQCGAAGNVTVGDEVTGNVRFSWGRSTDGTHSSNVQFTYADGNMGGTGQTYDEPVNHSFESRLATPAYFEFRVKREELRGYGDQVQDFTGRCSEYYDPQAHPGAAIVTGQVTANFAESQGDAIYSLTELRRIQGPDGRLDPIEEFERTHSPTPEMSSEQPTSKRTPGLGAALTLFGVGIAFACFAPRRFKK